MYPRCRPVAKFFSTIPSASRWSYAAPTDSWSAYGTGRALQNFALAPSFNSSFALIPLIVPRTDLDTLGNLWMVSLSWTSRCWVRSDRSALSTRTLNKFFQSSLMWLTQSLPMRKGPVSSTTHSGKVARWSCYWTFAVIDGSIEMKESPAPASNSMKIGWSFITTGISMSLLLPKLNSDAENCWSRSSFRGPGTSFARRLGEFFVFLSCMQHLYVRIFCKNGKKKSLYLHVDRGWPDFPQLRHSFAAGGFELGRGLRGERRMTMGRSLFAGIDVRRFASLLNSATSFIGTSKLRAVFSASSNECSLVILFWISLLRRPHTKRSRSASVKFQPKLQAVARHLRLAAQILPLAVCSCESYSAQQLLAFPAHNRREEWWQVGHRTFLWEQLASTNCWEQYISVCPNDWNQIRSLFLWLAWIFGNAVHLKTQV